LSIPFHTNSCRMNRNELLPDFNSGFNNSPDEKDYKTIVLLVLGLFIVAWQTLPSFFSTGTASDTFAHTSIIQTFRGQQQINLYSLSVPVTAGTQQNLKLLPSLPNQLRPLFFQPISINESDRKLLESIPGIGPYLSGQILNYRKAHGKFTDLQELLNVHGIGEKKLKIIKKHTVL
jgi:competence ComEA-like helix-hairpin-helix protein